MHLVFAGLGLGNELEQDPLAGLRMRDRLANAPNQDTVVGPVSDSDALPSSAICRTSTFRDGFVAPVVYATQHARRRPSHSGDQALSGVGSVGRGGPAVGVGRPPQGVGM
ncbi:hypothetical protein [Kibdelosporangium philippinense]|uniref:hypothetical protein n=1 Tax=Kibdelosporangium philippinense TaxID=211113 RepID=UPI0036146594